MYTFLNTRRLALLGVGICLCLGGAPLQAQDEDSNSELIQVIAEFVKDSDRDIRALAMQQIREEVPGEAATRKFAALLGELSPEAQSDLLDALGDRGDMAAREAIVERLEGDEEVVRAAALRALGNLGSASDVSLLAAKIAADSETERQAAQQSLVRLRGEDVNKTIVSAMGESGNDVCITLLEVLAARNAKEAIPKVLETAKDEDRSVRVAALGALRFLADANHTSALVDLVKDATDATERRKAELALLSLCSRSGEACTEAIVTGMRGAKPDACIALLRAVARAGGAKALEAVVGQLENEEDAVHAEALRALSGWPDGGALDHLLRIAKESETTRDHVLALRGVVRLAGPAEDHGADLELLATAMKIARRPQERRLVVGTLGGVGSAAALDLVLPFLQDSALSDEAGLAVTAIAEKTPDGEKEKARAALALVAKRVKTPSIRDRAKKLLEE
ncbi:MAG: HEAT repeat domain-containing protein [Pirellulaceae bacterium]